MSGIFGAITVADSDRVYTATVGQRVIWEVATNWVMERNDDLDLALSVFLDETTDEYKRRFKLPGGGYLQRRSTSGRYGSVKATGQWDVAMPLEDFGAQISSNDIDWRKMTIKELERHLQTVVMQNVNTTRFELLKALMNNTARTFLDEDWGSLTIQPAANGDAVLYPPVLGSDAEATEDHYTEVNYAPSGISDTNNPYETIRNDLEEHFGVNEGGSDIVVFINPDATAKTKLITGFVGVTDFAVSPGDDTATLSGRPQNHPGVLIGRVSGCWVIEWRFLPATYMIGIHMGAPAPLIRRVDPADMGIPQGLNLVAVDEEFPFVGSFYRNRFGFGVGNRLNAVVIELGTGGSYTIPTIYQ